MPLEITLSRTEPTVRLVCDDCARYVTERGIVFVNDISRLEWGVVAYDVSGDSGYMIHTKDGDPIVHVQCPECVQRDWMAFN